jgi:glycosyltransferase involved in cell wall biosynthesis
LDTVYQSKLETLAKEYPDVDIVFKGPYKGNNALREILADAHLVVFPSIWEENHPLVVREALLYGIPVLSSSLGGAPEAIEDGINGFVFNPYKEGDLAAKINLILREPATLEKITEGARNTRIESMDDHIKKIIKIYHDAMEKTFEGRDQ